MATPPLPSDAVAMLRRPNPAVMATLRSDGTPVSAATWYLWREDGRVLLNLDGSRVRLRHLRRDPRVTLTVLDADDWYTHVTLVGRVVEITEDADRSGIDSLSEHYTGHAYPDRESPVLGGRRGRPLARLGRAPELSRGRAPAPAPAPRGYATRRASSRRLPARRAGYPLADGSAGSRSIAHGRGPPTGTSPVATKPNRS